jgi:hypothetical protein
MTARSLISGQSREALLWVLQGQGTHIRVWNWYLKQRTPT